MKKVGDSQPVIPSVSREVLENAETTNSIRPQGMHVSTGLKSLKGRVKMSSHKELSPLAKKTSQFHRCIRYK